LTVTLIDKNGNPACKFYSIDSIKYDADRDRFLLESEDRLIEGIDREDKVWAAGGYLKVEG